MEFNKNTKNVNATVETYFAYKQNNREIAQRSRTLFCLKNIITVKSRCFIVRYKKKNLLARLLQDLSVYFIDNLIREPF